MGGENGAERLKRHEFFKGQNWPDILQKKLAPPINPRGFDYTAANHLKSPMPSGFSEDDEGGALDSDLQALFKDFDFCISKNKRFGSIIGDGIVSLLCKMCNEKVPVDSVDQHSIICAARERQHKAQQKEKIARAGIINNEQKVQSQPKASIDEELHENLRPIHSPPDLQQSAPNPLSHLQDQEPPQQQLQLQSDTQAQNQSLEQSTQSVESPSLEANSQLRIDTQVLELAQSLEPEKYENTLAETHFDDESQQLHLRERPSETSVHELELSEESLTTSELAVENDQPSPHFAVKNEPTTEVELEQSSKRLSIQNETQQSEKNHEIDALSNNTIENVNGHAIPVHITQIPESNRTTDDSLPKENGTTDSRESECKQQQGSEETAHKIEQEYNNPEINSPTIEQLNSTPNFEDDEVDDFEADVAKEGKISESAVEGPFFPVVWDRELEVVYPQKEEEVPMAISQ